MCSLSLEHTGEIIQLSTALPPVLVLDPLNLSCCASMGDLPLLLNFLFEGAGDLKTLLTLEIGVWAKFI
jgi:hypothetical protein